MKKILLIAILLVGLLLTPVVSAQVSNGSTVVSLLFNVSTGGNVTDEAGNNFYRVSTTVDINTTQKKFGNASAYMFNGGFVKATNAGNTNRQLATLDFFMYKTNALANPIVSSGPGATNGFVTQAATTSPVMDYYEPGNVKSCSFGAVTYNEWNHLLVQTNGTYACCGINGTITDCHSYTGQLFNSSVLNVGGYAGVGTFKGFIDSFRVSSIAWVGANKYYTVPTTEDAIAALPTITTNATISNSYGFPVLFGVTMPSMVTTYNWSFGDGGTATTASPEHIFSVARNYTVTLVAHNTTGYDNTVYTYINLTADSDDNLESWMHMNGVAGGQTMQDLKGNAWNVTGVTTDTTVFKYGNASALFPAGKSRISTPSATSLNFSTGAFTIEQWVYLDGAPAANSWIISRTSNSTSPSDGWGITNGACGSNTAWYFYPSTPTCSPAPAAGGYFILSTGGWHHVAVERNLAGVGRIIVDGSPITIGGSSTEWEFTTGNIDTVNPIVYGSPTNGNGDSPRMYLDETRISTTKRWNVSYTVPPASATFVLPDAEYVGLPFDTTPDPNPGSTLRYLTPPSTITLNNLTRINSTLQIQNVNITNNISTVITWNNEHIRVRGITRNETVFTGTNFTLISIDNSRGQATINATRPGGFSTLGGYSENRVSLADIQLEYWDYSQPYDYSSVQFFGNGFMKNATSGRDYPVNNFISTTDTFNDWITFSNFTANTTAPLISTPVVFIPEQNFTANRYLWNFGDGTTFLSANGSETHTYTTAGLKTVSLTAYLTQNTSVTNSTTIYNAINVTYNNTYINADFLANPLSGQAGTNVLFSDLTYFQNGSVGKTYLWAFGDGFTSNTTGDVSHVYGSYGVFTVTLSVNSTIGSSSKVRTAYIVISANQQTTFYVPNQVTFRFYDQFTNPINGLNVTATPLNFTAPDNWAQTLIGVSPSVNITGTSVTGYTGFDGSWVAPVLPSIEYQITVVGSGVDYTFSMYPSQQAYAFTIPVGLVPIPTSAASTVTYTLSNATVNSSYQYFNMSYSDTSSSGTTHLTFAVYNISGYPIDSITYTGAAANSQTYSQMLPVSQGQTYTYGVFASQSSYGWINQTETVTLANQVALIGAAPSWVELWFAIATVIIFGAVFSIFSKPFAMVGIPLLVYFYQFVMGWLPSSVLSTFSLAVMLVLGILIYIRRQENMLT